MVRIRSKHFSTIHWKSVSYWGSNTSDLEHERLHVLGRTFFWFSSRPRCCMTLADLKKRKKRHWAREDVGFLVHWARERHPYTHAARKRQTKANVIHLVLLCVRTDMQIGAYHKVAHGMRREVNSTKSHNHIHIYYMFSFIELMWCPRLANT